MKILVIGGTGIIGKAVVNLLRKDHEVIAVGYKGGDYQLNIEDKDAIEKMFQEFKDIDGVISTTGMAVPIPVSQMQDEHLDLAINNKLKGHINLLRLGMQYLKDGSFMVLTTGAAAHTPFPGGASIAMACAGVEAFVKTLEIEKEKDIRINVVRPAMVTESMELYNLQVPYSISAADTARVYKAVMELEESAQMWDAQDCLNVIEGKN